MPKVLFTSASLVAAVTLAGCAYYSYEPVNVFVFDSTTGEGVPQVEITVTYIHPLIPILNHPETVTALTDESGRVTLDLADYQWGALWEVRAPGFVTRPMWGTNEWYQRRQRIPLTLRRKLGPDQPPSQTEAVIRLISVPYESWDSE